MQAHRQTGFPVWPIKLHSDLHKQTVQTAYSFNISVTFLRCYSLFAMVRFGFLDNLVSSAVEARSPSPEKDITERRKV